MDREEKPVPVPRRLNNSSPVMAGRVDSSTIQRNGKMNDISARLNADASNANTSTSNAKPVPLPRKLLQRFNSGLIENRMSSKLSNLQESDFSEPVSDDVKRGTINIFKRGRSINPFDTDFESSLKDAKLLTAISFPSPLHDISPELRSRYPKVSMSSALPDDTNHYMEAVNKSVVVLPTTYPEFKVPHLSAANANSKTESIYINESAGNASKLQKSHTPSPTLQNESSETDGSESIYEPISSYSSSDSRSVSSEFPRTAGNNATGSPAFDDSAKVGNSKSEGKLSSFEACDFVGDQPRSSRGSFKKLDFQSRVGGAESRYERLRDESLSTSMPAIDDPVGMPCADNNSKRTTKSVISPAEPAASPPFSFLRRNTSNRSSDPAACSVSYCSNNGEKVEKKRSTHEYDDVAVEDGTVVFIDNQLNTASAIENNNSNSSIASIVMEFDPLFDTSSKDSNLSNSSSNKVNISNSEPQTTADGPVHRYEYVDGVSEFEDSLCSTLDPFTTDFTNPEYFPVLTKRDESLSTVTEEGARSPTILCNGSESSSSNSVTSLNHGEYEPVVPVPPVRPPKTKEFFGRSKPKTKSLEVLDDSDFSKRASVNSVDGKSDQTVAISQANFFRRLSNKIRLIPIREEAGVAKIEATRASTNYADDSPTPPCIKCFEEHSDGTRCKFTPFARPNIVYSSHLYRQSFGLLQKEFAKKRVVLAKGKLSFLNEKFVVLEEISLEKVAVIAKRSEPTVIQNMQELKCFQLNFVGGKPSTITLAAITEGERCSWMQKYMEVFAPAFPLSVISMYDRGGWCFLKETLTGNWSPSWLILKDRTLTYSFNSCGDVYEIDLRKTHSISYSSKEGDHKCSFVDNADVLTIEMTSRVLYVQTENPKITSSWQKALEVAAKSNGTEFSQMQLTLDNVPVIVHKCIDFLYAHGTLAEGIYRQSGSNARITQLLENFQKDAWNVQISPNEYSAHDVAGTLKRFFRTLPEPLVSIKLYQEWIDVSGRKDHEQKMEEYINLLSQLSEISYNIMKKLICHLYAVHELHEKNLMPLINLAPIWGPTLMNVDNSKLAEFGSAQSYKVACAECEVVKDLIENYYTLFRVDSRERDKEKKMQDALENFHLGSTKRKASGDMKLWIYIWKKDETSAINITLTPLSTSNTIIQQLCRLIKAEDTDNLALHEVVCQETLQRPLHPSEKVIETVLRWSIWEMDERKDNYLILRKNALYSSLVPYAKDPCAVYGDFKYADSKSKSYRKYNFSFSAAMLKYSKDAKASTELGSFKIEDIVWYMGYEPKRSPPTRWTFTFVKRNYPFKRSRDEPFFGNVVCCNSEEELHKWIGAMVVGEHPAGLYPSIIV